MSGRSLHLSAKNGRPADRPVDYAVELDLLATFPSTISLSGVISPPGTRGNHELRTVPLHVGEKKRSYGVLERGVVEDVLVGHRLARMDATAGLQISQPWPFAVGGDEAVIGLDLLDIDDVEQFLASVG